MISSRFSTVFVCLCACAAPVLALVPEHDHGADPRIVEPALVGSASDDVERLDVAGPSLAAAAARRFAGEAVGEWKFDVDRRTGRPVLASGAGLPLLPGRGNTLDRRSFAALPADGALELEHVEPLVRSFVDENADLLAPAVGKLVLAEQSAIREDGRLVSVYYDWLVDDVRVEGAQVFVRINSGNVVQFGAPLVGDMTASTRPALDSDHALAKLLAHAGHAEAWVLDGAPELLLQPEEVDGGALRHRLVWRLQYRVPGRIETWEGRVDARTGEIVGFRDINAYARAVGGVYPRTVSEQNETRAPMPFAEVVIDGVVSVADSSGAFSYSGGDLSTGLNGDLFNVNCQGCAGPSQPLVSTSTGIGWLDLGFGGVDQFGNGFSTPSDRNTFYHLNQARSVALKWLPSLGWLQTTIVSNTNIDNFCNAVYNGAVNFYRSGADCNNTGEISDVVHHEWGHGLDGNTRSGDGGTGEGTADVTAIHFSHSPLLGPGFRVNGSPVRNLDRNTNGFGLVTATNASTACGGGVHCQGQAFGQAAWELAQALVAKHGHHTGWRLSERLFFTSLPDQGGISPTSSFPIYNAYLFADDDDGNLANGTPNAVEIFAAFDPHGMDTSVGTIVNSPACSRPAQPAVTVDDSACDRIALTWNAVSGASQYQVLRATLREDTAYVPVATLGAGQTSFTDTAVAPGVDYWYVVLAVRSNGCESKVEGPQHARVPDQPILTLSGVADDDTPRGNRSGFPDPGEEVDLTLTLENVGDDAATGVAGTIVALTPGVTVLHGSASFADVPAGGAAPSAGILRFVTNAQQVSCGQLLQFRLVSSETGGCSDDPSHFSVRLGEPDGQGGFVCDLTPACYTEPTFSGLASAQSGSSCAEIELAWGGATSHCTNAEISFSVYRDTVPGFVPSSANLIASDLVGSAFTDTLLEPGQDYHYVVRAYDSRSGEEGNTLVRSAASPTGPDVRAPVFSGLATALAGAGCGETVLGWTAGLETCNDPVVYDVYRGTSPGFVPGPSNLIASTLSTSYVDAALDPGIDYTYLVRARDEAGNADVNQVRATIEATNLDRIVVETAFEPSDAGWKVVAPNDAVAGNWQWGDPVGTAYQSDDDATSDGISAWITGLGSNPSNGDVDEGTTTLVSGIYDMSGAVAPVVSYARWFTNDRGASPGNDPFLVEVSNDGTTWHELESVNSPPGDLLPLEWVRVEIPLAGIVAPTSSMRVRFTAADLGAGSLVEAGIDDFSLLDRGQGCLGCGAPQSVGTIHVDRVGDDVVIDWTGDPVEGSRFAVYALGGPAFGVSVRVGTTDGRTFVHEDAARSSSDFYYRVTAIDDCGNEGPLVP
jgi:hypothetical protein